MDVTFSMSDLSSKLRVWYQEDQPWNTSFTSVMRAIAAKIPDMPPIGEATLPIQEPFRLGQHAHMAFSPREVSNISWKNGKLELKLFSLGVWGAQGPMPLNQSELAYSRSELHDHTLTDFLDIFHHRAMSQLYRAWFVSQDTASLDRYKDEHFSFYIGSLIGLDPGELDDASLPVHARLASSAHLIREARNPEGLLGALHYYFEVPVQIEEFSLQWIILDKNDCSLLGDPDSAMLLGDGAILGSTVQDRQHKFKLILGPLTLDQYLHFSPWGQDLPTLREWVRSFVGYEYAWEVQLVLAHDQVPQTTLDGSHRLGYASWLERYECMNPVSGMSFEPEMY